MLLGIMRSITVFLLVVNILYTSAMMLHDILEVAKKITIKT